MLVAMFAVGCHNSSACPSGTQLLGQFELSYAIADAGAAVCLNESAGNAPLVPMPAGRLANLCAGLDDAGALALFLDGLELYYPGADGLDWSVGAGVDAPVDGGVCSCPLQTGIATYVDLVTADGGSFFYDADAGFSPVARFVGLEVFYFDRTCGTGGQCPAPDAVSSCNCNLPCRSGFSLSGRPRAP